MVWQARTSDISVTFSLRNLVINSCYRIVQSCCSYWPLVTILGRLCYVNLSLVLDENSKLLYTQAWLTFFFWVKRATVSHESLEESMPQPIALSFSWVLTLFPDKWLIQTFPVYWKTSQNCKSSSLGLFWMVCKSECETSREVRKNRAPMISSHQRLILLLSFPARLSLIWLKM